MMHINDTLLVTIITQGATVTVLLVNNWFKERREKRKHQWEVEQREMATRQREQIIEETKHNSALTVALVQNAAEQKGVTADELVSRAFDKLDGILGRFLPDGDVMGDAKGKTGRYDSRGPGGSRNSSGTN